MLKNDIIAEPCANMKGLYLDSFTLEFSNFTDLYHYVFYTFFLN